MLISKEPIKETTIRWISSFIIKLNICPFAKWVFDQNTVKLEVAKAKKLAQALEDLSIEFIFLDNNPKIETTLLIFPDLFKDFFNYLDFIDFAELLLHEQGYEGIYQLATFHPDYCFADTPFDDVSNYTNRAPYPIIHILRETGVEKAIAHYGNTDNIPLNNIATMKRLGLEKTQTLFAVIKEQ